MAVGAAVAAGYAVVKGVMGVASAGAQRGANEKARRDANQARVKAGKKQVRLAEKQIAWQNEQALESLNILINNNERYLDQQAANEARNWWLGILDDRDAYEANVAAYNQSVEDLHTALEFNNISNNIAIAEENNYMDDFHTQMRYEALEAKYALDDSMKKISFDEKRAQYIFDDRLTELRFESEKARLDIDVAMKRGASEREMLKLQNKAERAESAHQAQQEEIKGMQSKGKITASMAAGRSSRKALQAVDASMGMAQSMRVDALLNRNSYFKNQIQASYDNLYYQKLGYKSKLDTIDAAFDSAQRDYNFSKEQTEYAAKSVQRDYGLNRDQAADTLRSGLRDSDLRRTKIAASKYSADLQARSQVLNVPQPPRMDPLPYNAIRPEYQAVKPWTKKDRKEFFDTWMPHLEDENKIVGDAGGKPNPWMQGLSIGMDALNAYAGAGGFSGGGGGSRGGSGGGIPTSINTPDGVIV